MFRFRFSKWMLWFAIIGGGATAAYGQNYPNRPVRLLTAPAGGSGDFVARLIAQAVSGPLGQQMIVENRATVTIPEAVAKAGVTSAKSSALFPGLPAVAAALPGHESMQIQGLFAPAKTPPAVINRLNQEIVRVLNSADIKEKLFSAGMEAGGNSSEEPAAMMKSEMARMGKGIKDAGIQPD